MSDYHPLLTGTANLYSVALGLLAVVGLAVVAVRLTRALTDREPLPSGRRRRVALASVPIVIGAAGFAMLTVAAPIEGIPRWGAFYLLPAAFLGAIGALAIFRPTQAGSTLAVAAVIAFLAQILLSLTASRIDPAWVRDGLDRGSLAVTTIVFCLPAMLTALVLLAWAAPAGEAPWTRRRRDDS